MSEKVVVGNAELWHGNCLDVLPQLSSVDAIVTDPPYGLGFMGKDWDHGVPGVHFWQEALRAAKPGAHLLAFGGTRTFHRLVVAIEDAGWEIRDTIMWVYGSGFPKSLDVGKAIDKAAWAAREVVGKQSYTAPDIRVNAYDQSHVADRERLGVPITATATDAAKQWDGWGTALKPAYEPICVARKPLEGTVAANILTHGTGGINVDGCRVRYEETQNPATNPLYRKLAGYANGNANDAGSSSFSIKDGSGERNPNAFGRWPSNVLLSHADGCVCTGCVCTCPVRLLDEQSGKSKSTGGAGAKSGHPTVKPNALMRYLVRLVTPPGGTVLDPFMGSGSTGKAAIAEGFKFIGIETDRESFDTARSRVNVSPDQRESTRSTPRPRVNSKAASQISLLQLQEDGD